MTPAQILVARALRMLTDGRQHSADALAWAQGYLRDYSRTQEGLLAAGFTLRELSLGAAA